MIKVLSFAVFRRARRSSQVVLMITKIKNHSLAAAVDLSECRRSASLISVSRAMGESGRCWCRSARTRTPRNVNRCPEAMNITSDGSQAHLFYIPEHRRNITCARPKSPTQGIEPRSGTKFAHELHFVLLNLIFESMNSSEIVKSSQRKRRRRHHWF
jgi:hypothetical protein